MKLIVSGKLIYNTDGINLKNQSPMLKQLFNFSDVCRSGPATAADYGGAGLQPVENIGGVAGGIKI